MYHLCICLFILSALSQHPPPTELYTVKLDGSTTWTLQSGSGGIADAKFQASMNYSGWDIISIKTDPSQPDNLQAFAAGYIEGSVTVDSMWSAWLNFENSDLNNADLEKFVLDQDTWLRSQVSALSPTSQYWAQVGLILTQFDGLIKGYNDHASASQQLSYTQQLYLQLQDEVGDILNHIQVSKGPYPEYKQPSPFNSHCSVLIRLSPDGQNLFAAHDTWSGYDTLLRTYKYYQLNYKLPSLKSPLIAFSSYPGNLQSTDDFYITSQKLFVAETTNDVFNNTLYKEFISTQTVPEWVRVILANRMATNGEEWADVYREYNSGTYNNQFQVVDYKLFTPGKPLQANTLWIIEQIPGMIMASDETLTLVNPGFWPSYNIPFFKMIYNMSGYPAFYNQYGNEFSYTECARAQIFRRDAGSVVTMDNMKTIMRYNKFQTDPLSLHDACRSVSARCDLNTPWSNNTLNGFSAFGGIDSKITDNNLIQNLQVWAVSGPTADSQPLFAWTDTWSHIKHYGMPYLYDFSFQIMSPDF